MESGKSFPLSTFSILIFQFETVISKAKIKYIHSLEQKKVRKQEGVFVAEGFKSVGDLLREGFHATMIVATEEWNCPVPLSEDTEFISVTSEELRKASLLLHPQEVIGIFCLPKMNAVPGEDILSNELILCLDGVQDPGNLGTIIRTADWFGIKHIVCSTQTVDAFSPKVVQATMGSIARVNISYTDICQFLSAVPVETNIYGTLLDGENIYNAPLQQKGIIVMGNEGNGISQEVRNLLTHKLLIPPFPADNRTAESLNVSIATAIICAEFRSREIAKSN